MQINSSNMAALDYTFERREKLFRAEERREGIAEGETLNQIKIICKKVQKKQSCAEIADAIEADLAFVEKICSIIDQSGDNFDAEQIYTTYKNS